VSVLLRERRIIELLRAQRLLALALGDERGALASTAFYVELGGRLYLRGRPDSDHARAARASRLAAVAVWDPDSDPDRRLGVQLRGRYVRVQDRDELARAVAAYERRFGVALPPLDALLDPDAQSALFAFAPAWCKLHDSAHDLIDSDYVRWRGGAGA
jgi:uncharacterized protein YhbP (UPF0306 family)